jgi:hypothetical protein
MYVILHPPLELGPRDNVLAAGESRLEPLAPLHPAVAQMRLEPEMGLAFKLGLELRNAHRGPPARAGRLAAPQHAARAKADAAHEPIVVQAQRLRLPAAARGDEETPAAAVGETKMGKADFDRAGGEIDHGRGHVGGDDAGGAKPRSGNDRKVVLKDTHGREISEPGANANGVDITLCGCLLCFLMPRRGDTPTPDPTGPGDGGSIAFSLIGAARRASLTTRAHAAPKLLTLAEFVSIAWHPIRDRSTAHGVLGAKPGNSGSRHDRIGPTRARPAQPPRLVAMVLRQSLNRASVISQLIDNTNIFVSWSDQPHAFQ